MKVSITEPDNIKDFMESHISLDFNEEAIESLSDRLDVLSETIIKKAVWFCTDDNRDTLTGEDIMKAFRTIGGGLMGEIKYHNVKSAYLPSKQRDVVVYLPKSYDNNKTKNYPVIYMHDGQNLFDRATGFMGNEWYVNDKVEFLIKKELIEEVIIVGIYNGLDHRLDEYTWTEMKGEGGGKGKLYGEFLTKELKPYIDRVFRTKKDRNHTAVIGSSLGGLISYYMAINYPEYFSKIGMMSPSFWWNNGEPLRDARKLNPDFHFDFWLGAGTAESDSMVAQVNKMEKELSSRFGEKKVFKFIDPNAHHSEDAWSRRIHGPLIQFFGLEHISSRKAELIMKYINQNEWGN